MIKRVYPCIQKYLPGADPGFFLGGGAPLRNGVTNTNKPYFFCRIPVELESRRLSGMGGGVGAHPLHPPPGSAPAFLQGIFQSFFRKIRLLRDKRITYTFHNNGTAVLKN